ncbi:hypothetical protein [Thermogemmatispora tikiterensis]|uniref:Uncharacterized protein n=1 Tax=Thermogemmatispora tikiterensis TaxID=1825093 RepID=A0A328V8V0_9CHLR|nr:hypothetical protein [Thermogemmatispora tikiterensis]RAQ94046.1 hypothetical protein A4R35_00780 [Thermogemmatispora tikiterensis]
MKHNAERGIEADALAGEDAASNQGQSPAEGAPVQDPSAQAEFQLLPHEAWCRLCSSLTALALCVAGLGHVLWGVLLALLVQLLLLQHFYQLGSGFQQRGSAAQKYWREQLNIMIIGELVLGSSIAIPALLRS